MGRVHKKKFRTHVSAAKGAAAAKKQEAGPTSSSGVDDVAAAAVSAAFGDVDSKEWEAVPSDEDEADGKGALSRGQRKRLKRRTAFMRKMGMVKRVVQEKSAQKTREEHGMLADLKELQASLFVADQEAKQSKSAAQMKESSQKGKNLSGKQRKKLAVRELQHLKAVHTHPSFQGDPFAAIQMHLKNTVVAANRAIVEAAETKSGAKKDNKMDTE